MAYWVDSQGRIREGDEDQGRRLGYRPATEEDINAHNHALDLDAADTKGIGGRIAEGFERGLGEIQDMARSSGWTPPLPGSEAFGTGGGLPAPPEAPAPLPPAGAETFPEAFSPEARLRAERHPYSTGFGTGLAVAPFAGIAGAAGGALLPTAVPLVGGAIGAVGAEAGVEAVAQEYDDAWLEQRPFELRRAAANLGLFGLGDLLFRGGAKVVGKAFSGPSSAVRGARNVVAEAQAKAEKAGAHPARSVGAASAQEMNDPFDAAIGQMSDEDAFTLARDFDDHSFLVATDIADEMTRLNNGLSESLGNDLKYRDFEIAADAWDGSTLERQAEWFEQAEGMARDLVEGIELSDVDLGNHGKRVAADLRNYWGQINTAESPARRMYLLDQLKRTLDKRTMAIAGDFQGDQVARAQLLELIDNYGGGAETRGFLRESLEDPELFGHAADLQRSLNAPWHDLLKSWRKVTDTFLEATGEKRFGVMGAGRNVMEGTVERARSVIAQDPRALGAMRAHLGRVFDGYQGLIDARNAHGIVEKGGLPQLEQSIRNLMEDWNLGATLGVAKAKAAHIGRNPRHWQRILDAAEGAPLGVGGFIKSARKLQEMAGDLHIAKGTELARVWDEGLRRYAKHPSLAESPVYASYSPWMQEALRTRGAPIPGPPGGSGGAAGAAGGVGGAAAPGGLGQAVGDAVREHGSKVAGAGLIAGAGALGEEQPEGAAGAGAAGLGLLAGKRLFKPRGLRRLSGYMPVSKIAAELSEEGREHLHTLLKEHKVPSMLGKMEREFDASKIAVTADGRPVVWNPKGFAQSTRRHEYQAQLAAEPKKPPAYNIENSEKMGEAHRRTVESVKREGGFGKPAHRGLDTIEVNEKALTALAKKTGAAIKDLDPEEQLALLDYIEGGGAATFRGLQRGEVPADAKARYADALPAFESAIEQLQRPGLTEQIGPLWRGFHISPADANRLVNSKYVETGALTSTSFQPFYAKDMFADTPVAQQLGHVPVVLKFEHVERAAPISAAGFSKQYGTAEREAILPAGSMFEITDATRSTWKYGGHIELTLREVPKGTGKAGFTLAGLLGLGSMLNAEQASAAEPDARAQERPVGPSPEAGPATLYRDAVRGIDEGGANLLRQQASAALRRTPPAGRTPLRAFTGRRDLDAAVDAARATLAELQGDPSALIETLAQNLGDLPRTHPSVYMALTEKAVGIIEYLSVQVPERTGQTLLDPLGVPPSTDRSLEFAYKVVGATNPRQAMADIARLDIPPEELEAFQLNWAEIWEPFKAELVGQTMRRAEGGRPVDAEKLRQLDAILGMNGALDPSGSVEVAQHMLAAQEQAPAAPASNSAPSQAPSRTGRASGMLRTKLATIEQENLVG